MTTHTHSFLSHRQLTDKHLRREMILGIYKGAGKPLTDREVAIRAGFSDMNSVRPRITEMIEEGILQESDQVKSPATNRLVRCVVYAPAFQSDLFGGRF